jgi:dihydropteroate synthase
MQSVPLARGRRLDLGHVRVMAILNATPDSFSDGGLLPTPEAVRDRALQALAQGADLLDLGGESTRPGHRPVPAEEEMRRVLPALRELRRAAPDAVVSIDTRKAEVARAAIAAGADLVNDVSGGGDPAMAEVVREAGCALVVMRHEPIRGGLAEGCRAELGRRLEALAAAGVAREAIVLDPGLGFGDPPGGDPEANLALVRSIPEWSGGHPVLVGASRKRFVGTLTGVARPEARVAGSVAVALLAAQSGAAIVRVHDVAPTVEALRVLRAFGGSGSR